MWLRNFALEGFTAHFAARKWAFGLRNGTRVPPRGGFAAAKFFTREGLVAAKLFRKGTLFSQHNPIFAGWLFWLRNVFTGEASFRRVTLLAAKFSQENKFLCFCASLVPYGFPPLLLKFLLILIIQKV